ncbi:MAG: uncharacterized protein KVP18_002302 [Porospora cf. gigantea A]|uniref:uncharacterized protein n=1 Tax=Porospora cf. gigantea A TaxID=2853593 RepID=UPI0035598A80|nr:MAG: hypothetical protein KVP18_002302 [Porospora cf. gigantea A]
MRALRVLIVLSCGRGALAADEAPPFLSDGVGSSVFFRPAPVDSLAPSPPTFYRSPVLIEEKAAVQEGDVERETLNYFPVKRRKNHQRLRKHRPARAAEPLPMLESVADSARPLLQRERPASPVAQRGWYFFGF